MGLAPLPFVSSAGFIWPSSVSQPRRANKGPAATAKVLKALELSQRFGALCSRSHSWVSLFAELQFAVWIQEWEKNQTRPVLSFVAVSIVCCDVAYLTRYDPKEITLVIISAVSQSALLDDYNFH